MNVHCKHSILNVTKTQHPWFSGFSSIVTSMPIGIAWDVNHERHRKLRISTGIRREFITSAGLVRKLACRALKEYEPTIPLSSLSDTLSISPGPWTDKTSLTEPVFDLRDFQDSAGSVIGLTGLAGSGKSTIADKLCHAGYQVIKCDDLARSLRQEPGTQSAILDIFPEAANDDGLDDYVLASVFFDDNVDEDRREAFQALMRHRVHAEIERLICSRPREHFIIENALMFENDTNLFCDFVVNVSLAEEERVARLVRRGWSQETIRSRDGRQYPDSAKSRLSDITVDGNDQDAAHDTITELSRWMEKLERHELP